MVIVSGFVIVQPRLPFTLVIAGGLCGALAGVLQHLSIKHDPHGFVAASSLMGVRRALTNTAWGRRYIAWLYFSKFALVLVAFLLLKGLDRVLFGYLTAYFTEEADQSLDVLGSRCQEELLPNELHAA